MPSSPRVMARRLSQPFVDLSNLLRPILHEERGISSDKAQSLSRARRDSGAVSSADVVFVDDEHECEREHGGEVDEDAAGGLPISDSAGSMSASGTVSNFHQLFLTDSRSSGSTAANGSPPRLSTEARRRSAPLMSQQTADLFAQAGSSSPSQPATRPKHASRQSWGSGVLLNQALPALDEEHHDWAPALTARLEQVEAAAGTEASATKRAFEPLTAGLQPSITLIGESPERMKTARPLVVETCPTPPTADRTAHAHVRPRLSAPAQLIPSLIRSTTHDQIALHADSTEASVMSTPELSPTEEADYAALLLRHPTANSSRSSTLSARRSLSNLFTAIGSSASPRSSQPSPVTPNTQYGFPFPDSVGRWLDEPAATAHSPPTLSHLRPTYAYAPPSPSIARKSRPSTPAPDALLGRAASGSSGYQTGALKNSESNSTLFSWDLAHLPAPGNPREEPFKVSTRSLFLPTAFLGGHRGSGQFGDQYGPVGRKAAQPAKVRLAKSSASRKAEDDGAKTKKKRRMSVASLGTLLGGVELVPTRTGGTTRTERQRAGGWKGFKRSVLNLVGAAREDELRRKRPEEDAENLESWVAIVVADR